MLLLCFVVYTVFFMPFRLAFDVGVSTPDEVQDLVNLSDTWFISDLIMDLLFTLDVFLRFFTAGDWLLAVHKECMSLFDVNYSSFAVPMPGHEMDGLYITYIPDIFINYWNHGDFVS